MPCGFLAQLRGHQAWGFVISMVLIFQEVQMRSDAHLCPRQAHSPLPLCASRGLWCVCCARWSWRRGLLLVGRGSDTCRWQAGRKALTMRHTWGRCQFLGPPGPRSQAWAVSAVAQLDACAQVPPLPARQLPRPRCTSGLSVPREEPWGSTVRGREGSALRWSWVLLGSQPEPETSTTCPQRAAPAGVGPCGGVSGSGQATPCFLLRWCRSAGLRWGNLHGDIS